MFWIQSITKRRISLIPITLPSICLHTSSPSASAATAMRLVLPPLVVCYPVRRPVLTVVATADALFVSKCVAIKINGVSLPSGNRFFQHSTTAHNKPDCARSSTAPHSDLPRARRYIPLFPVIYARISSLAAVQCSPFSPSSSPSFPPRCVTTPLCTSTLQRH